ncbi:MULTISPECIES: MSHA biogenesis protein MshP [Shewanella]|uniref:MSHA biogenesis protein MshP n=1 Tax=Shewanella TaxID=22 RepID=UPI003AAA6A90
MSLKRKLTHHTQRGSALIIGIFVLTVLFLVAASLIRIVGDADESVNVEVWGTRALFSANSGADAALAQLFPLNGSLANCSNVSPTWTAPANALGFYSCSVTTSCNAATVGSVIQYRISSLAICQTGDCSGGGSTSTCLRVSRQVEVEARGN